MSHASSSPLKRWIHNVIIPRATLPSTQICVESIENSLGIPDDYRVRESLLLEQAQQRDQCRKQPQIIAARSLDAVVIGEQDSTCVASVAHCDATSSICEITACGSLWICFGVYLSSRIPIVVSKLYFSQFDSYPLTV